MFDPNLCDAAACKDASAKLRQAHKPYLSSDLPECKGCSVYRYDGGSGPEVYVPVNQSYWQGVGRPLVCAGAGTLTVVTVARTAGRLPHVGLLFVLCAYLLAVQLSTVVHELGHAFAANGFGDSGARTFISPRYWIPFYGFSQRGQHTTYQRKATNQMLLGQAGFAVQFVYLMLVTAAIAAPAILMPCLLTALGFIVFLFVYPHIMPPDVNDFRDWA